MTPPCTPTKRSVDEALVWEVNRHGVRASERPSGPMSMRGEEGMKESRAHTTHRARISVSEAQVSMVFH